MTRLLSQWLLPASLAGTIGTLALVVCGILLLRMGKARVFRRLCLLTMLLFWFPAGMLRGSGKEKTILVTRSFSGQIAALGRSFVQGTQPIAQSVQDPVSMMEEMQDTPMPSLRMTAFWVWALVMILLLLLFAAQYLRFLRRQKNSAEPLEDPAALHCLQSEAARLRIQNKKLPRLRSGPDVVGPMLVGALRPIILLPQQRMEESALRCALSHELCHWRAGDIPLKWAALVTAAVHWFNPAAWILIWVLDRSCEYACDAAAVSGMSAQDRFAYGEALLKMHTAGAPAAASGFSAAGRSLKRRLEMILRADKKDVRHRVLTVLIATGMLAAAALSGCAASALTSSSQPQSVTLLSGELAAEATSKTEEEDRQPLLFPVKEGADWISRRYTTGEHIGIDLAAKIGTPILAAADGTVMEAKVDNGGYGIQILLDHGDGRETFYGHCSSFTVEKGEQVKQGQVIGYVGATGNATGNFCHFELRIDGEAVDPTEALGLVVKNVDDLTAEEFELDMVIPIGQGVYDAVGWDPEGFNERLVIAADPLASVSAPMEGTVQQTGFDPVGGNYVQLSHPDGSVSRYEHLGEILVEEGQQLERGEIFATVGHSGEPEADTNHLTILAWRDGEPVDVPRFLIDAAQYGVEPLP